MYRSFCSLMFVVALAGCGGITAPSVDTNYSSAPKDPNMGQVVDGSYIVAPGDTLAIISNRTNTPIRALIDNNRLQPPYNLRPGQALRISERQTYIVQSGDTVSGISRRFRVQQSALVELNELKPPYLLRIGQSLTLPSAVEATQTAAVSLPRSTPITPPNTEVDAGSPAVSSAGISSSALPASNTKSTPVTQPGASKPLEPGQTAPLASPSTKAEPLPKTRANPQHSEISPNEPDLTKAEEAVEGAYEQQQVTTKSKPALPPATPIPAKTTPAVPEEKVAAVAPPSSAGFVWPVQGKVISKFGTTSDGLRNDGINISAPAGAPVVAAAEGTVAYAGNQLRGFGNLVLIRHSNGLISAYAHNQSLLVQKGDKVKRGAVIARVGQTGNVAKPQLHFEIRKGEQPVDPSKYLDGTS